MPCWRWHAEGATRRMTPVPHTVPPSHQAIRMEASQMPRRALPHLTAIGAMGSLSATATTVWSAMHAPTERIRARRRHAPRIPVRARPCVAAMGFVGSRAPAPCPSVTEPRRTPANASGTAWMAVLTMSGVREARAVSCASAGSVVRWCGRARGLSIPVGRCARCSAAATSSMPGCPERRGYHEEPTSRVACRRPKAIR